MQTQKEIHRGEIWLVDLGTKEGSIQGFLRPIIVVSNSLCCKYSPVLHGVPTTTQLKRWMPTHIEILACDSGLLKNSTAMCEQIQLLPRESLIKYIGYCRNNIIKEIDKGIAIQFGLIGVENKNDFAYA